MNTHYMYALLQLNLHPRVYWNLNFMLVTLLNCYSVVIWNLNKTQVSSDKLNILYGFDNECIEMLGLICYTLFA